MERQELHVELSQQVSICSGLFFQLLLLVFQFLHEVLLVGAVDREKVRDFALVVEQPLLVVEWRGCCGLDGGDGATSEGELGDPVVEGGQLLLLLLKLCFKLGLERHHRVNHLLINLRLSPLLDADLLCQLRLQLPSVYIGCLLRLVCESLQLMPYVKFSLPSNNL